VDGINQSKNGRSGTSICGSLAANYIRAAIERRKVTNTFQRCVAPEIVRELLKPGQVNTPGGTIYISRAAADALAGHIETTSLGSSVKLKGKKDGFEVLTLGKILEGENV